MVGQCPYQGEEKRVVVGANAPDRVDSPVDAQSCCYASDAEERANRGKGIRVVAVAVTLVSRRRLSGHGCEDRCFGALAGPLNLDGVVLMGIKRLWWVSDHGY
jgi:hypothetical protein